MGRWFVTWSGSPTCLLKQPPGCCFHWMRNCYTSECRFHRITNCYTSGCCFHVDAREVLPPIGLELYCFDIEHYAWMNGLVWGNLLDCSSFIRSSCGTCSSKYYVLYGQEHRIVIIQLNYARNNYLLLAGLEFELS